MRVLAGWRANIMEIAVHFRKHLDFICAIGIVASVFSAQLASAACDPNLSPVVTLSLGPWQTNGTLQATVTNTYPRNDGFLENASLYLDVEDPAHLLWRSTVGSGVPYTVTLNTACIPTGAHTIIAVGANCIKYARTSAGFSVTSEPTVSASLVNGFDASGDGMLSISYNFPNTSDYIQREIFVELDGVYIQDSKRQPGSVSGSYQYAISISCLPTGPHTFTVRARPCSNASRDVTAAIPVNVDSTPRLTLSASVLDANGNISITGTVSFPTTRGGGFHTGDVYTYINDETTPRWHDNFLERDGTLTPHTLNVACLGPYTIRAVATSCSNAQATQQISGGTSGMTKPIVTLKYLGIETQTLKAHLLVTVKYAFPIPSSGWTVRLDVLSSIDVNGNIQPGQLLATINPTQADGTWSMEIAAPSAARQIVVAATMTSCRGSGTTSVARELPNCGSPPSATQDPVIFEDGNVRVSDNDPLPRLLGITALVRTYDSQDHMPRLFGTGWATFLDQRLMASSAPTPFVYFLAAENGMVIFAQSGSAYIQQWPAAVSNAGSLRYDAGSSTYEYRPAASSVVSRFRSSDGRFIGYVDVTSKRSVDVAYDASGLPVSASDSWTGLVWQFHIDSVTRRVTSIDIAGRPDLLWTYSYDGSGNLLAVLGPGSTTWRTYTYGSWGMVAAYDAIGNLIESHTYDGTGFGDSSTGPNDEISSIQYGLSATNADDTITRVTTRAGTTIDYTLRAAGGAYRTVHVNGGCASCRARNTVYVLDENGRVIREQAADGYVTQTIYTGSNVGSVVTSLKPSGCDPQTAADHCRLTEDTLASAALDSTSATLTTTYTYADAYWPERPTRIDTTSALKPSGTRSEALAYDVSTGTVLTRTISGWAGSVAQPVNEVRTTITTLYGSNQIAAFDPGGSFNSAWLSLAQPVGLRKSVDGPRTDVTDITTFVYYPIDNSVPSATRGHIAAVRNAAGHIVRYENYDVFGNAQRVVDPNGVATEFTFDAFGRLLGTTTKGVAGCSTAADPLCATDIAINRTYSAGSGPLSMETDANGNVKSYEYDGRGRTVTISRGSSASSLKERMEFTYDAATGKKSVERYLSMENGVWTERRRESFSYDTLAQLSAQTHSDNSSIGYNYDDTGSLSSLRDENHAAANTRYSYDPARRLASAVQTLGSSSVATTYTYDVAGNLASVTDPNGNTTQYGFDDFGEMILQTSPVTGATTYTFNQSGELLSSRDANGATTTRTYDSLNRVLTAVSARTGQNDEMVSWSYDSGTLGLGRVSQMSDPAGATAYTYDRRGLLLSESRTNGPVLLATSFNYDANGNRTVVSYPSGAAAAYTYDYAGRPTSLSSSGLTYVSGATYLPFGPEMSVTFLNGTTQTHTYDSRYRIQRNTLIGPSGTIADYSYTEDSAGNIASIHDMLDSTYNREFGYDDLNRLTTANSGVSLWGAGSYRYDSMGNLLARNLGATVEVDPNNPLARRGAFTAHPDALPAPGSVHETYAYAGTTALPTTVTADGIDHPLSYDAAGNEIRYYDTRTYSPRNFMSSLVEPSEDALTHTITYGYDGRGVRVTRSEGTSGTATPFATRHYVYSPELNLLAVTVDDNPNIWGKRAGANLVPALGHQFAWFNGRPVLDLAGTNTLLYTFDDHLGTPILQTDATGTVVWRAEYEPYGDVWAMRVGLAGAQPLRFPGQEYENKWTGTEERYNIARWYRAGWGRYLQADPLGHDPSAMNVGQRSRVTTDIFAYAKNNPNTFIDPNGLCPCGKECASGTWSYVDRSVSAGLLFGKAKGQVTFFCSGSGRRCSYDYSCTTVGLQAGWSVGVAVGIVSGARCKCAQNLPDPQGLAIGVYRNYGIQYSNDPCQGGGLGWGLGAGSAPVVGSLCDATSPIVCKESF